MNQPNRASARFWHQVRARPRLVTSIVAAMLTFSLLPTAVPGSTRALITWDVGAGLYLILAWVIIWRASIDHMRWRARLQDDGAAVVLLLTVTAAAASLVAIVAELSGLKALPLLRQGEHVALAMATFAASWLLVHTAFALHYAHAYYVCIGNAHSPPLDFPRQETPVYPDFLYFSMVIGMTSQTADVAVSTTPMRRLVMCHGMVAFIFNTTLLALTINIAASLLG